MIFPLHLSLGLARYIVVNRLWPSRRMPMVLLLEPTLRCNLNCPRCSRNREQSTENRMLTEDECLGYASWHSGEDNLKKLYG